MALQENENQNADFYKDIENEINDREEQFIEFLSHQLESLIEHLNQSTLNVASVVDAGIMLELQHIKEKTDIFSEKMKILNSELGDDEIEPQPPYQNPIDHSEVAQLIDEVKVIIEANTNQVESTSKDTNQ
ncbi:uncharacterized protein LOC111048525 [Nilaparvata lugens]|uniref:uncharacterized protein LOC111048525 n=1 Tax=Nilaparvata lugens TaxID=108931 RepID=UPI000B999666|nr:uncharacterized protein LOC111048525 [Nilaparvata lugens]